MMTNNFVDLMKKFLENKTKITISEYDLDDELISFMPHASLLKRVDDDFPFGIFLLLTSGDVFELDSDDRLEVDGENYWIISDKKQKKFLVREELDNDVLEIIQKYANSLDYFAMEMELKRYQLLEEFTKRKDRYEKVIDEIWY